MKFSVLMNVLIDDKVLLTPLVKFDVLMTFISASDVNQGVKC